MSLPFTLGTVELFLVATYNGFERPNSMQLIDLLDDGTGLGNDQVLQQGNSPYKQATLTGTLASLADITLVRGYYDSREELTFMDGDGVEHGVRILEFSSQAYTGYWVFSMSLIETTPVIVGS